MYVSAKNYEKISLLSALEIIQLILALGTFTIALIKLIMDLLKNDKNNRYFSRLRLFLHNSQNCHRLNRCCLEELSVQLL